MKRMFLAGMVFVLMVVCVVSAEEKTNLTVSKYPVVGLYLENIGNYIKVNRQNSGVIVGGIGAGCYLGGMMMNSDSTAGGQSLMTLGTVYMGAGLLSYIWESSYEKEVNNYLQKTATERISMEEKEKIAVITMENIIREQSMWNLISGFALTGTGTAIIVTSRQNSANGIGLGFILSGLYTAFLMKTPEQIFLEKYKKDTGEENNVIISLSHEIDRTKLSVAYNF